MKTLLNVYFTMYLEDKGLPSSDICFCFAFNDTHSMGFYGRLSDDFLKSLAKRRLSQDDARLAIEAIEKGAFICIEDKSNDTNKHKPSNMCVVPHVSTANINGLMFAGLSRLRNEVDAFVADIARTLSQHGALIVETGQTQVDEDSVRRVKEKARSIMDALAA